jgi:hypothetical protein
MLTMCLIGWSGFSLFEKQGETQPIAPSVHPQPVMPLSKPAAQFPKAKNSDTGNRQNDVCPSPIHDDSAIRRNRSILLPLDS